MADAKDLFHEMVAGKIRDIRKGIDEIEKEISERQDIDKSVLEDIGKDIIQVKNRILEVEQFSGAVEGNQPFPKVDSLEHELVNLEGQRRFERVSCWRDLTSLRRDLRIFLRELNDLLRKAKLVQNDRSREIAKES